jgi:hypothetical protein
MHTGPTAAGAGAGTARSCTGPVVVGGTIDSLRRSIEALSAIDKGSEFLAILAVIEHLVEGIDLDSDAGHSLASLPWCGRALEERSVLFLEGH